MDTSFSFSLSSWYLIKIILNLKGERYTSLPSFVICQIVYLTHPINLVWSRLNLSHWSSAPNVSRDSYNEIYLQPLLIQFISIVVAIWFLKWNADLYWNDLLYFISSCNSSGCKTRISPISYRFAAKQIERLSNVFRPALVLWYILSRIIILLLHFLINKEQF